LKTGYQNLLATKFVVPPSGGLSFEADRLISQ